MYLEQIRLISIVANLTYQVICCDILFRVFSMILLEARDDLVTKKKQAQKRYFFSYNKFTLQAMLEHRSDNREQDKIKTLTSSRWSYGDKRETQANTTSSFRE